jgi:hypothetical protein
MFSFRIFWNLWYAFLWKKVCALMYLEIYFHFDDIWIQTSHLRNCVTQLSYIVNQKAKVLLIGQIKLGKKKSNTLYIIFNLVFLPSHKMNIILWSEINDKNSHQIVHFHLRCEKVSTQWMLNSSYFSNINVLPVIFNSHLKILFPARN